MEQETDPSSLASTRAVLVAKIRRATSLPRMENGRRPKMHVDGASDGDYRREEETKEHEFKDKDPPEQVHKDAEMTAEDSRIEDATEEQVKEEGIKEDEPMAEGIKEDEPTHSPDDKSEFPSETGTRTVTPDPPVIRKRRSRSRSRSRNSRDLRGKRRTPTPTAILTAPSGDSSADEAPQPIQSPQILPLISPIPSHFAQAQASRWLSSPSNDPSLFYPGTSPPTPMLPTLDAIRKGLSRSNSACARFMAFQKLTGEIPDQPFSSPSPTPPPSVRIARNNTVGGGERNAVRQLMLRRLAERTKDPDGDLTSSDERGNLTSPLPSITSPYPNFSNFLDQHAVEGIAAAGTPSPSIEPTQEIRSISPLPAAAHTEYKQLRRRSVVIEEEDPKDEDFEPDALSADDLPISEYLSTSQGSASRQVPSDFNPFTTPLQERPPNDEDEERVLYHAENRFLDAFNHPISWVADPVPERMPLDEDDEEAAEDRSTALPLSQDFTSQSKSTALQTSGCKLVIEAEVSPDMPPSHVPPSPSSAIVLSNTSSTIRTSDDANSPQTFPTRLSIASRIQGDRSPLATEFGITEGDESRSAVESPKRNTESSSTSTWDKLKNTFNPGRRSRTNSILKRDNIESSVSRESGASINSAKMDKGEGTPVVQQSQTPVMPASSASASMLSSPAVAAASRGGVSPVPPASSVDLLKYQNAKLFPFPGMKLLEEQRNRTRAGISPFASSPDVSLSPPGMDVDLPSSTSGSSSITPSRTPEAGRDRKLSHQASDTRLLALYSSSSSSATLQSPPQLNGLNLQSSTSGPVLSNLSKLPTNREGVRRWLKVFGSQSSSSSTTQPPVGANAGKKPSLSDLLKGRKEDLATDWEEVGSDKSRTPTSATASTILGKAIPTTDAQEVPLLNGTDDANVPSRDRPDDEKASKPKKAQPSFRVNGLSQDVYSDPDVRLSLPSAPEHASSTTPDPMSSVDYSGRSTSESSSVSSSQHSRRHSAQGTIVLQRLDEMLGRGSRSPMWASAIDDPPRKLVLSSPVLQVVNANTVKDRFLFLFSDILVIAKPIMHEQENLLDGAKPNPLDRKFIVKNVVVLRHLRFNADREDTTVKSTNNAVGARNPIVRTFVHQFAKDPELAISNLLDRTGSSDDPAALGQFLFRTLDLDRARLGEYLSKRTSKLALKTYIDSFGFTGLRVDKCLRSFLTSLHIPTRSGGNQNILDYFLDTFAVRWYEANAPLVAYDKEVAVRLVRSIVQLNDVMHGGISSELGNTRYPKRHVTEREFLEAFKRYDTRGLVSDELLKNLWDSIHREQLVQARNPSAGGPSDVHVTIKRALPPRLTYKVQSEPVVLRIPQPDPQFAIFLYGQDLTFEPQVLTFAKSPEASFRVTGTSLGPKIMIMRRSGANALAYSGLPHNFTVVVERAFMRNTFQIAFATRQGVKRRYMFSVDDPAIRHEWTMSLKRQLEAIRSVSMGSFGVGASKFHRAAENIAFEILQEVLLGPNNPSVRQQLSILAKGNLRISSNSFSTPTGNLSRLGSHPGRLDVNALKATIAQSHSRSKVYHRQGPGRLESELNLSGDESRDSQDFEDENDFEAGMYEQEAPSRADSRLWSGRDLQMQCQQNSSIALVLAYLQVGSPDHAHGDS